MLTIHHSNRLEALAGALAAVMREPLASPFAGEIVVVQSRGVARWLSLKLADTNDVCANVRFPFANAFAWELYRSVARDIPEHSPFDPEILTWRVLRLLPSLESSPAFAPVRQYVGGDVLRRFELSERLAALYDEYLVYRPDWIVRWESGEDERWQAELWRRLASDSTVPHRAALHRQVVKALAGAKPRIALPQRVSVFGAPALAPSLLELFRAVGEHSEVHLFVQNPCREYWGDIAAEAEVSRRKLAGKADAAYLDTGNRLLASLGKQGRDYIDLLTAAGGGEEREWFVDPGRASLLASIQSDVLDLTERAHDVARKPLAAGDRSLQVHSCHSAMREVEVLHDQLLALFSAHPDLEPSDVVVMTPDIEGYAPYVEAVFGTAEQRVPFNISDRSAERSSTLAVTFISLLELAGSRYEANRVLGILDEPAVRRRYRLGESDFETARRWVRESQVRWGINGAHRARFGLPPTEEHTWRFGLDRLLLGYALPGGGARLFEGVLPYDEVEGGVGEVLGRFASFAEAAIALDSELAGAKPLATWRIVLNDVLGTFFDPPFDRVEELEALRGAIAALESEARLAGFGDAVPLAVLLGVLRRRLEVPGRAFLSGGVTFCAMVPMRSLPFEVVCMIGMNDGAFPRLRRREGFDLMAGDFRKGDRSRRDDDRYLFLESILSAKRSLYISYTGRNIREDTVIPPSVLVSELLDYVAHGFECPDGANVRERLVTSHPLQAFSPRYFRGDDKLFSFSRTLAAAARAAGRGERTSAPLVAGSLPPPEERQESVDLETLVSFYRNPTRFFMRERLGIRLEEAEEEIEPHEPFTLDSLDGYGLKQQLLALHLDGDTADALALAHAAGVLPHGVMGDALFQRENDAVQAFARKLEPRLTATRVEPVTLGTDCGSLRLVGTLPNLTAEGLLLYRAANVTVNDRIGAWIRHLALNVAAPPGVARVTRCIGQDETLEFAPVQDARERLRELLELYCEGLRRPLRFFPKTACEYAKKWELTSGVVNTWNGSEYKVAERDENAYFRLAFRAGDPLDEDFERVARLVLGPLYGALEKAKAA